MNSSFARARRAFARAHSSRIIFNARCSTSTCESTPILQSRSALFSFFFARSNCFSKVSTSGAGVGELAATGDDSIERFGINNGGSMSNESAESSLGGSAAVKAAIAVATIVTGNVSDCLMQPRVSCKIFLSAGKQCGISHASKPSCASNSSKSFIWRSNFRRHHSIDDSR